MGELYKIFWNTWYITPWEILFIFIFCIFWFLIFFFHYDQQYYKKWRIRISLFLFSREINKNKKISQPWSLKIFILFQKYLYHLWYTNIYSMTLIEAKIQIKEKNHWKIYELLYKYYFYDDHSYHKMLEKIQTVLTHK